ncbi:MAG: PRC-barrel domain-containing protein [Candidatus Pacearchaeota archaeon]
MKEKIILIIFLFIIILLIQSVSALTANSSNYSVSLFGTGMATGIPLSDNYNNTIFLSEPKGTTRNAESSSLTANIGFFENTLYYRTVSITSYSVSPKSAVVGSTIGLYISALNAQSVWAKIISPNSQEQTLSLINGQTINYLPSPSVVGRYNVTFYANSSTGAIASVVDYFELTAQTSNIISPPSGGGGTTTIIEKCTYNWDCTPWSVCADGKQSRVCKNIGTCEGNESKPVEEKQCSEVLFDISLKLKNIVLTENRTLKFIVDLVEKIGTEKIDVHIKYSIINRERYEIFSQIETKAIQKTLSYEKEIEEIKLIDGEYILRVDILYGNLQRAFAEQKFKVNNGKIEIAFDEEVPTFKNTLDNTAIIILIILIILISIGRLLFLFIKDHNGERFEKIKRNKRKSLAFGFVVLLFAALLTIILKTNITGKVINSLSSYHWRRLLIPLIIILFIILLFTLRNRLVLVYKKITEFLSITINKNKKPLYNSVKGLINKKVYSESGDYIGKIKDVILGENRIESLKIELDKKHKFKANGIVINYSQIKNVGEIVIIEEKVAEHLV